MKIVSTLVATAALSCSAFGAQVMQSQNVSVTNLDFTKALTFNAFDPTLGTLTDIQFIINASTADSVTITNTSGRARSFTVSSSVDALFGTAGVVVYTETIPTNSAASPVLANGATTTVNGSAAGNATAIYSGFSGSLLSYTSSNASNNGSPTNPILVSNFVGSGKTFTYNFDASNNSSVAGGSNNSSSSGTAGGSVTILYDYRTASPTPEPATMGLFGSALLGLGFLKFRTKKS